MAKDWTYKSGQWNLVCDVCGKKIKAGEAYKVLAVSMFKV